MNHFSGDTTFQDQIVLLRKRGLDTYLDRDLPIFQSKFDRLKKLLEFPANNENYIEAYQLLYYIFDVIPIMYNRLSDISIFRAQPNKPNDLFISQSRISYNPDLKKISPGKFNVWYEAMFYGCLPYIPEKENDYYPPSLNAALECCKDLIDESKMLPMQDITVGRWKIKCQINIINLCFDDVHLSHNYKLREINNQFMNTLLSAYSNKTGDFVKQVFQFFSSLCRTGSNERAYYILTALFAAIRNYYKTECQVVVDGLISSSAASNGRGLNIVMTPEAVDKNLILNAVTMYRYFLVFPEAKIYASYPCSEIIENHLNTNNFSYSFKNYIMPAQRFLQKTKEN